MTEAAGFACGILPDYASAAVPRYFRNKKTAGSLPSSRRIRRGVLSLQVDDPRPCDHPRSTAPRGSDAIRRKNHFQRNPVSIRRMERRGAGCRPSGPSGFPRQRRLALHVDSYRSTAETARARWSVSPATAFAPANWQSRSSEHLPLKSKSFLRHPSHVSLNCLS